MTSTQGLRQVQSAIAAEINIDGRTFINFGGCAYLGIAKCPDVLEVGRAALAQWGSGASISTHHGLITPALSDAQREAKIFFDVEDALFLGAGYLFGNIALRALRSDKAVVFYDAFSHSSLVDGIAASGMPAFSFEHCDADSLQDAIQAKLGTGCHPLIVTDAMFSTFGNIAPLDAYLALAVRYDGRLIVDESHSFGVLGANGRGGCEHHGVDHTRALIGGSLGKAFGICGGVVAGLAKEIAICRSTPPARGANPGLAAAAAMAASSLAYVRSRPDLLASLRHNVAYAKERARGLGLDVGDTVAPILAFSHGDSDTMLRLKAKLFERKIFVYKSNYVGAGEAGVIRCAIFADHQRHHIDALMDSLRDLL